MAALAPLAYVYVDSALLASTQLTQRFRSTFIALHEHLDTYLDKKDSAIVVSYTFSSESFSRVDRG